MESNPHSNPYTAPNVASNPAGVAGVDFVPIMRRWEYLRICYNAILVAIVLVVTVPIFPQHLTDPAYWAALILGGLLANLCFLTGPAIEAYGTCFRLWNRTATMLLFLAGLGLTALLAIGSIASF